MKILVLVLDGAHPQDLFEDEQLENLRRLMAFGCYGRLQALHPESSPDAWHNLAPGPTAGPGQQSSGLLWQHFESLGHAVILVGVSQELWASGSGGIYIETAIEPAAGRPPQVHPPELADEVYAILLEGPLAQAEDPSTGGMLPRVLSQNSRQLSLVRHLIKGMPWSYFQYVDSGLDMLIGETAPPEKGSGVVSAYLQHIDREVGALFELLSEETVILLVGMPGFRAQSAYSNSRQGAFILASANNPLNGELQDVAFADLGPTLLALSGLEIPTTMAGTSIVSGMALDTSSPAELSVEDEEILRERLSGLGYIE